MPSELSVENVFYNFFLCSAINKKEQIKLKLSKLDKKYKSYKICWNIVFTMQLTIHRETMKTSAAIGCE